MKNFTLADARITGYEATGGIVGYNAYGTVENCHTLSTVTILTVQNDTWYHGGIVGNNGGDVRGCTSAATVSNEGYASCSRYGGIVGYSSDDNIIQDCLVLGGSVSGTRYVGAIVGEVYGALTNNYHTLSGIGGVGNKNDATNSDQNGARYAYGFSQAASEMGAVVTTYGTGSYTGITAYGTNGLAYNGKYYWYDADIMTLEDNASNATVIANNNGKTRNVVLDGRTLYKDGAWNTICLPFNVTISGSPLDGADARELIPSNSGLEGLTLTLNFTAANAVTGLVAGKPYLIKWASGENIVNPKFTGVTIKSTTPENVASTDDKVTFKGIYSPISWETENKSVLYLGAANTLYWPKPNGNPVNLNAFRAYFELADGVTASAIELNFDDETTSLNEELRMKNEEFAPAAAWYTLDGRKLNAKPTAKGLYIVNGRKVVVK